MKVMFFVDFDNFKEHFLYKKCYPDFNKVPRFLFEKINGILDWNKYNPRLIRTYIYSGEYSKALPDRIKQRLRRFTDLTPEQISKFLSMIKNEKNKQYSIFKKINEQSKFVELKLKPLQFSHKEMKVFQKGTDVQLAVDLVHHAYQDNFDVAFVCSGDVDLLESLRLVKNHGKKIVLIAHPNSLAYDMKKECDFFFNLAKLNNEEINKISFAF